MRERATGRLEVYLRITVILSIYGSIHCVTMDTNYKSVIHKPMFYCPCIFLLILIRLAAADPETDVAWQNCRQNSFTSGSVFQINLNTLLDSLVDNIPSVGYKISSYGQSGNKIYGIIQCRADLILIDCRKCAAAAKTDLVNACHNTSGLTQLDGCFLRYDNYNFISNNKDDASNVVCNKHNVSTQPKLFTQKVRTILSNITNKAPTTPALFAAGSILGPSSTQIYAFAQCWRHVSRTSCGSCLSLAYSVMMDVSCQEGSIGAQISTLNCFLRFEMYTFFNTSILPQAATTRRSSPTSNKRSKIPIIVGLLTAATVLLSIGTIVWKRKRVTRLVWNPRDFHNRRKRELIATPFTNLKSAFEYDVLREATRNFHEENKLGEGGFGSGILNDGREIAIKRLSWGSRQGDIEFLNESNLVSRVQHRNLVKLLGCCVEGSERLLVYEFLPNRSLDKILFDPKRKHLLEWKVRHEIIVGTARGLAYLHEESEIRIIHRDIKASNLLLDDKLKPKISDFGLARFIAEDLSHISTRVAGTLGYMAPEYALHGQLTEKADVFSFGVLVLEIVSGRKNQGTPDDMGFLVQKTWRLYETDQLSDVIDTTLLESSSRRAVEEGTRVAHIGLLCTQASPALRPTMSRVVHMLTTEQDQRLPVPTSPAFIDVENEVNLTAQSSGSKTSSTGAEAFSSVLQAR
eukprot:Gb_37560 [translate_table: standard]